MDCTKNINNLKLELSKCSRESLLESTIRLSRGVKDLKKQEEELTSENLELEDERTFLLESIAGIHKSMASLDFRQKNLPVVENEILSYVKHMLRRQEFRNAVMVSDHVGELGPIHPPESFSSSVISTLTYLPSMIGEALFSSRRSRANRPQYVEVHTYNHGGRRKYPPNVRVHKKAPDALCGAFGARDEPIITTIETPNAHPRSVPMHSPWVTEAEIEKIKRKEVPEVEVFEEKRDDWEVVGNDVNEEKKHKVSNSPKSDITRIMAKKREKKSGKVTVIRVNNTNAKVVVIATIELPNEVVRLELTAVDHTQDVVKAFATQMKLDMGVVEPIERWLAEVESVADTYPAKCHEKLDYVLKNYG